MADRGGLARLRDALDEVGARMGLARAADAGLVWSRWEDIVGAQVARHAEPTSLRQGLLRVRTSSPAWAGELLYLRSDIAQRANELLGRSAVSEVRIWTAPGAIRRPRPARPPTLERRRDAAPTDPQETLRRAHEAWLKQRDSRR